MLELMKRAWSSFFKLFTLLYATEIWGTLMLSVIQPAHLPTGKKLLCVCKENVELRGVQGEGTLSDVHCEHSAFPQTLAKAPENAEGQ